MIKGSTMAQWINILQNNSLINPKCVPYFICAYRWSDFNIRLLALCMETHVFDRCIRGYKVSKDVWMPVTNEELVCAQESGNSHDPYAVAIKKGGLVVGHVPRKFQPFVRCSYVLEQLQLL